MSSDFATLDPDDPTTKKIKKILREKHPGYKKNSIDGEAFDSACETISFYLTRGRIEEARAVLKVIPFVPISLSEKEIENILQEYKKKDRYWQASHSFLLSTTTDLSHLQSEQEHTPYISECSCRLQWQSPNKSTINIHYGNRQINQ